MPKATKVIAEDSNTLTLEPNLLFTTFAIHFSTVLSNAM